MKGKPCILLFRQDLRTTDNPALYHAAESGLPVLPVYLFDEDTQGPWAMGGASKVWLHYSLKSLEERLAKMGLSLHIAKGPLKKTIPEILKKTQAKALYLNTIYEPSRQRDEADLKRELAKGGLEVHVFNASHFFEPWDLKPASAPFYKVFTPYYNACIKILENRPLWKTPEKVMPFPQVESLSIEDLHLLPHHPDWSKGIRAAWTPGEKEAKRLLDDFLSSSIAEYSHGRDFPGGSFTSRLSPYLHFGEISPFEVLTRLDAMMGKIPPEKKALLSKEADHFLREVIWREFACHILHHYPDLPDTPYQKKFEKWPWSESRAHLNAWKRGMTGYPIVDAGMRELWQTGYMHNRVRMIAASFLIKDLLIDWREGEKWFWDTLVDADLASNSFNWQWVAGSGFDAAPYFRIFNPTTQGEKFDAKGDYVRRWVPEIAALPDKWLHSPSEAPVEALRQAGITLGVNYPHPIINHKEAREKALALFKEL